jgi:hypothetical protein
MMEKDNIYLEAQIVSLENIFVQLYQFPCSINNLKPGNQKPGKSLEASKFPCFRVFGDFFGGLKVRNLRKLKCSIADVLGDRPRHFSTLYLSRKSIESTVSFARKLGTWGTKWYRRSI